VADSTLIGVSGLLVNVLHQLLQAECDHSSHSASCGHGPHLILLTKKYNFFENENITT